ncbi:hypothetical protein F5X99DRAFT_296023 [Biscogniauxia marginata]|nr:hypothetical protein F5X99DRAFT_296023 [Biscogniauxia marginata]
MNDYVAASTRLARTARQLLVRDDDEETYAKCHPAPNIDLCEKTGASSHATEISIGVICVVFVGTLLITLTIFHVRRQRRDAAEWPKNNQELDDYGLGAPPVDRPKNTYQQPRPGERPPPTKSRNELDNLARSLRNPDDRAGNPGSRDYDYGYSKRRDDDVTPDMKPVEPASQL